MNNLITEINGTKYLLVEILQHGRDYHLLAAKLFRHKVIYQGVKTIEVGGFFKRHQLVITVLVPESEVESFCEPIQ